jgi:NAD-dependent protein deacetylase/lipoamidase
MGRIWEMVEWFDPQTSVAIDLFRYSENIVVFTGAGISTDSGIPDFRSPGGIWERFNPEKYGNYNVFLSEPKYYWELEREYMKAIGKAKPNISHKALVRLEKMGKLKAIITQNIDNLHQMAGSTVPIIEIHGNASQAHCLECKTEIKRKIINKKLKKSTGVPTCPKCGGKIKTDVILINEPIAEDLFYQAIEYAEGCDLFIVIGSSLEIYPANQLPIFARKGGAKIIFINKQQTYMDKYCTLRLLGNVSAYLPTLVASAIKK